ncbi:MAG: hypothetical protein IPP77_09590 [Bacteroidetes bacterium]|nr:hypothetical protein [Bacteroidota bacterium]
MSKLVGIFWFLGVVFLLGSCNDSHENSFGKAVDDETYFQSKNEAGKWTTDQATAQELKSMGNTIENFTLLNQEKYESLMAYQEFGELLLRHADRVTEHCRLDENSKNLLCINLNRIREQANILKGTDVAKSKEALNHINEVFSQVDSTFNYDN